MPKPGDNHIEQLDLDSGEQLLVLETFRYAIADADIFDDITDKLDITDDAVHRVIDLVQQYLDDA